MEFRPCIDIHNGKVKQIVGGSLKDQGTDVKENFISEKSASFYANLYKKDDLSGGHIIILNKPGTKEYELSKEQAKEALLAYPNGLQIGGGINPGNGKEFIDLGASHVIVTSYVFYEGKVHKERLEEMKDAVGKEHLVLDLSCRKKDGEYYIVTDRWQNMTKEKITADFLDSMMNYADEFLIHAVDVEGKNSGIEENLIEILGKWNKIKITYAGGVSSMEDIEKIRKAGNNKIDVTIGSSLDLFGGTLSYEDVKKRMEG